MVNNTTVGALRVEATLDSGKFIDGARKLRAEAAKTETAVKSSFNAAGAAIKGFAGGLTAGLSIGLLGGLAKKALDYASAIGVTAKQLGVTTKELQTFRYAAEQVGVKNAEADKGVERLGVTLGKAAAGSKTAAAALGAVGVSLNDIKTKTRIEIFGQIADQMIKQGGAAKNAAAANAIFGESASSLTPLLDRGSQGITELSQAAERLGIVLSDEQIQKADETAHKLQDVQTVLTAQISGVVADNADSILGLANALGQLASAVLNFLGSNPQAALGILGALAGSRFGLPGAVAGGLAGAYAGGRMQAGSTDPKYRAGEIRKALSRYREAKRLYGKASPNHPYLTNARKELQEQTALGQGLVRPRSSTASTTAADIPQFLAGGGSKSPRKARSRAGPRDRSDDVRFQFDQEQRRAEMDILRAKQDLAHDYVERASLAIQMLNLEKESFEAGLQERVRRAERDFAEGKITESALQEVKAEAVALKARNDEADALKRQAVLEEEELRRKEEVNKLAQGDLDRQRQLLESRAAIATTAAERRKIELELLELAYAQKRQALQHILDTSTDYGEIETARRDMLTLNKTYGNDRQGVINQTRGPWEEYAARIPDDAGKMQEALEQVRVDGVEALTNSLMDAMTGVKSLGDAFREVANQIVADLLRIYIRKMLVGALGNLFGSATSLGGGGLGQSAFPVVNGVDPLAPLPAMAKGGTINIRGNGGTDRNILSINSLPVARVSAGERIDVSNGNEGAARIRIEPSPYFDVVVGGVASRVAAPMAGQAAMIGAAGGDAAVQRRRARSIP